MTALEAGLLGSVMSMAGAPAALLYAFFNSRAERLILKRRMSVLVCIVGACVLMVLTGFFIYYFLPGNWQWMQWVNIGTFVLTLLMCIRRLRVWYACNQYGDELTLADLGMVVSFAYSTLRYNVELVPSGAVYLQITIKSFIDVTRRFKITDMDTQTVLSEIAGRLRQRATPTASNPHPDVEYDRDGLETAPVHLISMMHDTESRRMLAYVN